MCFPLDKVFEQNSKKEPRYSKCFDINYESNKLIGGPFELEKSLLMYAAFGFWV